MPAVRQRRQHAPKAKARAARTRRATAPCRTVDLEEMTVWVAAQVVALQDELTEYMAVRGWTGEEMAEEMDRFLIVTLLQALTRPGNSH